MANLADDDLLLVQRTSAGISTNYSITGSALKEDLTGVTGLIANPVEVLTPLDGSGLSGDIDYYPETSSVTTVDTSVGGLANSPTGTWEAITYGNGTWVAAGMGGGSSVMSSTDGINWTDRTTSNVGYQDQALTFGNGVFVLGLRSGMNRLMYSTDGINWSASDSGIYGENMEWRSVAYGEPYGSPRFVAFADAGSHRIARSNDGKNWTVITALTDGNWESVAFGNGKFVAVEEGNPRTAWGSDGSNWSYVNSHNGYGWTDIAYGHNKFVVVGYNDTTGNNNVGYSDSDYTWSSGTSPIAEQWEGVAFGNGRFVAVGKGTDKTIYSDDGVTWYEGGNLPQSNDWMDIEYGGGMFIAVSNAGGGPVAYSTDGIEWSSKTILTLTNDKVFNSSDNAEMNTIDQVLPAGTVVDGEGGPPPPTASVFSTTLYQPNGADRSIATGIDNTEKSLVWFKHRDISYNHLLVDSIRPIDQTLTTNHDGGNYYTQDVAALTETGVNLRNWTGWINHNDNQRALVWNFRAKPNFFDIVTWTGNDSVREIPHNLGSKPGFIIIKRYDGEEDWTCYHRSLPNGASSWVQLNDSGPWNGGGWFMNNTEPTSTHFTVGSHGRVNTTGWNYVAYIFAHNEDTSGGNIKCGSYTGTGSPGNVVDLGFEPEFFMVKNISAGGDPWIIVDAERGMPASGDAPYLTANTNDSETGKNIQINPTSTGVVMNENGGSKTNENGYVYIYVAIAKDAGVPDGLPTTGILSADADASTPSITLTDVTGTWTSGMTAVGRTQLTKYAPGPDDITFTSQNAGTTPFNGTDATLAFRRWTLESRASAGDPWVVVDTYEDYDITASQDGATPWSSNKPTLSPNTMYRVKVAYISTNADPVESVYNTFTTGSN